MQTEQRRRRTTLALLPVLPAPRVEPAAPAPPRRPLFLGAGLLAALLAAGAAVRLRAAHAADEEPEPSPRRVQVVTPRRAKGGEVTLPATLQPFQVADLHARVGGYLKSWKADIGDRVKTGEVLGEIDTPELDREHEQALALWEQSKAELAQAERELEEAKSELKLTEANEERAQANLDYAAGQAARYRRLAQTRAASAEDYEGMVRDRDTRRADLAAARADVRRRKTSLATRAAVIRSRAATAGSRHANVRRLGELLGFKKVVAPFAGVVVRRSAEVGLLVQANNAAATPLFRVVQDDRLRAQVAVPQALSAVGAGDAGIVRVPEHPGQTFPARVARTASAVEPGSRTLLVELELPNRDGRLLAGTFAQVALRARRTDRALLVPAAALLMRSDGAHVAVVGSAGQVRVRKVRLGRDHGHRVEVLAGLSGAESLVLNPSDDLADGQQVEVSG